MSKCHYQLKVLSLFSTFCVSNRNSLFSRVAVACWSIVQRFSLLSHRRTFERSVVAISCATTIETYFSIEFPAILFNLHFLSILVLFRWFPRHEISYIWKIEKIHSHRCRACTNSQSLFVWFVNILFLSQTKTVEKQRAKKKRQKKRIVKRKWKNFTHKSVTDHSVRAISHSLFLFAFYSLCITFFFTFFFLVRSRLVAVWKTFPRKTIYNGMKIVWHGTVPAHCVVRFHLSKKIFREWCRPSARI